MDKLKYFLAIAQNYSLVGKGISSVASYGNWEELWHNPKTGLLKGMSLKTVEHIAKSKRCFDPDKILDYYKTKGIKIGLITDPDYPALLKEIYDPPAVIYYKGQINNLSKKSLAVVGSRKLSRYGEMACNSLLPGVVSSGVNIISGLARGCDTTAHKITLENKGLTFAVLGSGLDCIYPHENRSLAEEIEKTGAVISEFPLGVQPARYHFPMRNRIIAGLSQATLVIEAAERSGSLITARMALEYNREVLTVPGGLFNTNSVGTNNLLKLGAIPVTNSQEILESLN